MKRAIGFSAALAMMPVAAFVPVAPAAAADAAPEANIQQLDRVYLRMAGSSRKLRKLSKCVLEKDTAAARRLFEADNWTQEQNEQLSALYALGGRCLWYVTNELRTSGVVALGGIADGLMDSDGVNTLVRQLPNAVPFGGGEFTWNIARPSQDFQFEHVPVANCLINRHGEKVAEVLRADQTSDKERKVFNSMTAELKDCSPHGKTQHLHPVVLRAALAAGYYSASHAVAQNDNNGGGD